MIWGGNPLFLETPICKGNHTVQWFCKEVHDIDWIWKGILTDLLNYLYTSSKNLIWIHASTLYTAPVFPRKLYSLENRHSRCSENFFQRAQLRFGETNSQTSRFGFPLSMSKRYVLALAVASTTFLRQSFFLNVPVLYKHVSSRLET